MLSQTSAVIRFFSFVTLVTFFPSCVAVWNFVPEREKSDMSRDYSGPNAPFYSFLLFLERIINAIYSFLGLRNSR